VYLREDWVERAMLAAKRHTRGKLSSKVEVVALQRDLDERALQRVALELGVELEEGIDASSSAAGSAVPLVYNAATHSRTSGRLGTNGGVRDAGHTIPLAEWASMQVRRALKLCFCFHGCPHARNNE
jgi:hypothetical protein